jgi:superfamily II DNA or RNA helicase
VTQQELGELPKDTDNDFAAGALGQLLGRPKLVGDVVSNWLRIANGKRTLCFAVNKSHAAALVDSFQRQGVPAELLTDQDDESTREAVIARLEAGTTSVVVNCFLMSYGVDIPSVETIILARPTRRPDLAHPSSGGGRTLRATAKDRITYRIHSG